jgi:hypothetical protein
MNTTIDLRSTTASHGDVLHRGESHSFVGADAPRLRPSNK